MSEIDNQSKEALQRITDELAEQAKQRPGSPQEAESKERRSQAEKDFQDTK